MCSGKMHLLINMTAIGLVAPAMAFASELGTDLIVWGSVGACLGSVYLTPDLDLKQARANRAWGYLAWIWGAYHRCFTHRRLSHVPVLGTLTRLVYLALIIMGVAMLGQALQLGAAGLAWNAVLVQVSEQAERGAEAAINLGGMYPRPCGALLCGLISADILHVSADLLFSRLRRVFQ